MIGPEHETARTPASGTEGFGDAVTYAFGDAAQELFGSVRLGLVPGDPVRASGLAIVFHAGVPIVGDAAGAIELAHADWGQLDVGDLRATIVEPLRAWELTYDGDEAGFELRFEARGDPAEVGAGALTDSAADLHGYEQLCRVHGSLRHGARRWQLDCLGQRGHQWGAPDWERLALARTVTAWFEDGEGFTLAAVRPADARGHEQEIARAALLGGERPAALDDVRLSTTLDESGCQLRAGLELWVGEEDAIPYHVAGQAVCGTTLELGRLRLDAAFFTWRMDGREGVGRYDVLRHA